MVPAEDLPPSAHAINTRDIGIPGFEVMAFRYDRAELSAMVKPFAFHHLFEVEKFETAIFYAPDGLVLGAPIAALDALERGASVVLTPHFTTPPAPSSGSMSERSALRMGAYNLGFIAARRCEETARLLDWWGRFLQFKGLRRPETGLYLDSKPLDLAGGYCEHVHICRSAGANVGPWNLADRPLTRSEAGLEVGGVPLEFVRFGKVGERSAVQPTHRLHVPEAGDGGLLDELLARYARLLDDNNHARFSRLPYSYDAFLSGRKISAAIRAQAVDRILFLGTKPFEANSTFLRLLD
jgi:hypothetical protein